MIVRIIASDVLMGEGNWVTAHMSEVPRKGDTVLVLLDDGTDDGVVEHLTVNEVRWPIAPSTVIRHHADADMPEIVCGRTDDVGEMLDRQLEEWRDGFIPISNEVLCRNVGVNIAPGINIGRAACTELCDDCKPKPPKGN